MLKSRLALELGVGMLVVAQLSILALVIEFDMQVVAEELGMTVVAQSAESFHRRLHTRHKMVRSRTGVRFA